MIWAFDIVLRRHFDFEDRPWFYTGGGRRRMYWNHRGFDRSSVRFFPLSAEGAVTEWALRRMRESGFWRFFMPPPIGDLSAVVGVDE